METRIANHLGEVNTKSIRQCDSHDDSFEVDTGNHSENLQLLTKTSSKNNFRRVPQRDSCKTDIMLANGDSGSNVVLNGVESEDEDEIFEHNGRETSHRDPLIGDPNLLHNVCPGVLWNKETSTNIANMVGAETFPRPARCETIEVNPCIIDIDGESKLLPINKLIPPSPCSPYIQNLTSCPISLKDDDKYTAKPTLSLQNYKTNGSVTSSDCNHHTVVNLNDTLETFTSENEIPPSPTSLMNKSSDSVQLTTPNGSCLRDGSKGGGSTSTGPHVQFETPTPSQDDLFEKSTDFLATNSRPGYLMRLNSSEAKDSDGHGVFGHTRRRKRQHHNSGSSTASDVGSSASVTSDGSEFQRKAPDGGWGWVIVAASFFIHCIADGVTMSFGVLFIEFLDYFKESKSFTSWVGSLFMAIPLLAGPLASIMTDHFGCRKVTIIGSVIASIGFLLSALADSILVLLITLGLITGLGLAVCYVAAIVIVAFYFEKKRSLATGIAVAGSGIGTFVFAPFIQYLIENWGWRGSLIILAGIFLNMCVCGALMRDLEWTKKRPDKRSHSTQGNSRTGSSSHSSESLSDDEGYTESHPTCPTVNELRQIVQSGDVTALLSPVDSPTKFARSSSMLLLPTFLSRTQTLPQDILSCLNSQANAFEIISQMYPHLISSSLSDQMELFPPMLSDTRLHQLTKATEMKNSSKGESTDNERSTSQTKKNPANSSSQKPPIQYHAQKGCDSKGSLTDLLRSSQEYRKASLDPGQQRPKSEDPPGRSFSLAASTGSSLLSPRSAEEFTRCTQTAVLPSCTAAPLRNMRVNRQSMTYRGAMLNIHRYRLRASSCPDIYRNSMITIDQTAEKDLQSYLVELQGMGRECLDMPYCRDLGYIIFSMSNFILYLFYDTVYMYLVDHALENGIDEDSSANLISIIGILNCVGMIGMGYIGDKEWYPLMFIYNASMVMCGLAIIIMPFCTSYPLLAILAAVFGFFISANYALTSVILVDLISLDSFTKAYGLLLLTQGMANLVGPPLVGLMRDTTENYVLPFVVSGVSIVGCGLMLFIIPIVKRRRRRMSARHRTKTATDADSAKEAILLTNITSSPKTNGRSNSNNANGQNCSESAISVPTLNQKSGKVKY